MTIHLTRDLENLHANLLVMCSLATRVVHEGVDALMAPEPGCSDRLSRQDDEVDRLDVEIEDACLKMLALHQPVARDLRRIATVLKIISDLERIADLGVNIAERAAALATLPPVTIPTRLRQMSQQALDMLDRSIASYMEIDVQTAQQIRTEDEAVNELNRQIIAELSQLMHDNPDLLEPAMHLFSASRHIERIADHATNIAEDIIYMAEGEIVRHQPQVHLHRNSA